MLKAADSGLNIVLYGDLYRGEVIVLLWKNVKLQNMIKYFKDSGFYVNLKKKKRSLRDCICLLFIQNMILSTCFSSF